MKDVVAIDGPSASGKSTTARMVARELGYLHLDTGAMYRAVTVACLRQNLPPQPSPQLDLLLDELDIQFDREGSGDQRVLLAGEDVSGQIRSPEVNAVVSSYSALPQVRKRLVKLQQQAAEGNNVVCEGRDIGTRVFPDARHKFFIVADLKVRAERRRDELEAAGTAADLEELMAELARRDKADTIREHSPLVKAEDAIELDTSNLTIEMQVERVIAHVKGRSA
ncbi:MAG: (d)CMP kinase [Candidatus Marinimicrobia bacterium]|nr:(d)CMP kinase [Candidatus Neomarinimicrobiota bacterium]